MKALRMFVFILLLISLPLSTLAAGVQTTKGHQQEKKEQGVSSYDKVVAYFTSWSIYGRDYQIMDIDGSKITHINYAFANIKDGEIVLGDPWADVQKPFPRSCEGEGCLQGNFGQLLELKAKYPHLKTLISVGGWTWSGNFSDVALTEESRAKFAESAVDFVRNYGLDGVDLDWEYPVGGGLETNVTRPEDKQNYTLLLEKIRTELDIAGKEDGKQYLLTIAGGASKKYVANTELDKIAKTTDWINIMTYDFHGSWESASGHNAPLFADPIDPSTGLNADDAVKRYINAGVPSEQIVLGIPFYGRGWSGCNEKRQGQYEECSGPSVGTWEAGILDYTDIEENYINKNGFKSFWNEKSKVPWLYNKETGTFISYENEKSIGYKTDYIKSQNLGGAMFWELNGDRNQTLLNKMAAELLSK
jgi:chitinase